MAMMSKNIFPDILSGRIPAEFVYQDDDVAAFRDINPQAPTHILIIPRKEIRTHADLAEEDLPLIGKMHAAAAKIARDMGFTDYRLLINCGESSGQTVPHLHMHLLAGREFHWPPG